MDNLQLAFWQFSSELHPDLQAGLEVFYGRVDSVLANKRGVIIDSDIDRLMQKMADIHEIEFLVVMAVGTLFSNQTKITEVFRQAIQERKEKFLVMGHLINRKERYCGLHEQCFIVNMNTYRELGRPPFGNYRSGPQILCNYSAGPSIHDDYTPRYVLPEAGDSFVDAFQCGWNVVHSSLKAGMAVHNLPDFVRSEKIYSYPDDNGKVLNKNLELLYQMQDMENSTQRQLLGFLFNRRFGFRPQTHGSPVQLSDRPLSVYLLNSEFLVPDLEWVKENRKPLDHFLGPASGFLEAGALFSHGFHAQTRVTYFDFNPKSLHYKKRMLEEFDGRFSSFKPLFEKFQAEDPNQSFVIPHIDQAVRNILQVFGSEKEFRNGWKAIQKLPKNFIEINLISQFPKLFTWIQPEQRSLLAFSDIFTAQNELTYGWSRLNDKYSAFLDQARSFPNLVLSGHDTKSKLWIRESRSFPGLEELDVSF